MVITRQAWSAVPFDSAPVARSQSTGRISAAPASGRKVIEVSSQEVIRWSIRLPDDVLDDDEGDGAAESAVEVGLDVAGLDAPQGATAVPGERGEAVHRAVDDVLVDGRVDVGDGAAEDAHEVDEPVDQVLVQPVHDAGEEQ